MNDKHEKVLDDPKESVRAALRCPRGEVDVTSFPSDATPLFPGSGSNDGEKELKELRPRLDDLQERLYANSKQPRARSLLMVLQGMDGSGKGGTIRHVVGMVDPQGVRLHAFKAPTEEELAHDFLWRIRRELPEPGQLGIFDRSQYEDVLIGRVNKLARAEEIEARYGQINDFEAEVTTRGTRVVKFFLNVSKKEQKQRFLDRINDPEKYYKYNPGDLVSRSHWDAYMEAYGVALTRCNPDYAPWYVIPADKKWYRNWAITTILIEELEAMGMTWPPADFDLQAERLRVAQC
ncbi:polyphosphate:nucleotide phosphotransferase, PPK2 family [Propionibacterium cyclohexanicum]|uniref:Polyphosphate:nucleotide phosphotransferase, PPK2 family n=1 Tax=Propionibacterium cyclohexanicum TaxID=64702 RepID=A0A1H9QNC1_9ACTN|nr:PPK2 family polyphosphate kinase [Propionibacterium cyclohexanicum]SER61944.1 polyphosphate:nucleotide phosphotransferase, PPK2 family [Propionibacterium cyclohexanicum]